MCFQQMISYYEQIKNVDRSILDKGGFSFKDLHSPVLQAKLDY